VSKPTKEMATFRKKTLAKEPLKIHKVVKYPEPVLATQAAAVTVFDDALRTFVAEMFESMYVAEGIGLAAPQIAVSQRITVIDVSFRKDPKDKLVLINPEVIETRGKQTEEEGCLSLPDIREKVHRAAWVKVRAQNEHGKWFEVEGEELLARALLHEIDHLNGILFIDRISRLKREFVLRKIRKLQKNGEW
jgi:peptide deformylase